MRALGRLLPLFIVLAFFWWLFHFALAQYFWHRGNQSYRADHYEQAIEYYNRALSWGLPGYLEDPECLYCDRGNAYDLAGRLEHALADYDEALRRDSNNPRFYYEKSVAYRRSKRYKEAVDAMDKALVLPRARPADYLERADSLIALGEYQKAISDLDHFLDGKPQDPSRGLDLRGWAYYKSGDFPKALADYESALKARPNYAQALHDRGELKQAQGDAAAAKADYDLARAAGYKE